MPVDPDFAREERIKRLRALVKSGTDQMLVLYDAIPAYLRLSDTRGLRPIPGLEKASKMLDDLPDEIKREQAIDLGYMLAERNRRTYTKVYKWLVDADNASPRNLTDDRFVEYKKLAQPHTLEIDSRSEQSVEEQIVRLSEAVEERLNLYRGQLSEDGEHEDIAPALRDAPGGWPHLRDSGLLTTAVLDGYLTRMRKRRTKAEISDAIGAAKEVTEATMKALVKTHGVVMASKTPDLADYWKVLKPHLVNSKIDKALGTTDGSLLKLLSAQVTIIGSLGELRNKVGTGHGKTEHPAGLQPSHALYAVDQAHSLTRFLTS
jgi:hypothetical protein